MSVAAATLEFSDLHRFSVEDYHRLVAGGILGEGARVELLDGVLVAVGPQTALHALVIRRLNRWLRALPVNYEVLVQLPLTLSGSEPEPDIAVCRSQDAASAEHHPFTAEFVVEVAYDSLRRDRTTKTAIYARAMIPEYWVIDLRGRSIEVFREPSSEQAAYATAHLYSAEQAIQPGTLAIAAIRLSDLLAEG